MRPTIDQIKSAIQNEATRHGMIPESVKIDIPPAIEIPGRPRNFAHSIDCKCGFKYQLVTQHSANTPAGSAEFHQALSAEMSEHGVVSCATAIYELHEPTN